MNPNNKTPDDICAKEIYICHKCGNELSEEIMGQKCPFCREWTYHHLDKINKEDYLKELLNKLVKDRTNEEHFFLIKNKFNGSVRDYLLSMGNFKDD